MSSNADDEVLSNLESLKARKQALQNINFRIPGQPPPPLKKSIVEDISDVADNAPVGSPSAASPRDMNLAGSGRIGSFKIIQPVQSIAFQNTLFPLADNSSNTAESNVDNVLSRVVAPGTRRLPTKMATFADTTDQVGEDPIKPLETYNTINVTEPSSESVLSIEPVDNLSVAEPLIPHNSIVPSILNVDDSLSVSADITSASNSSSASPDVNIIPSEVIPEVKAIPSEVYVSPLEVNVIPSSESLVESVPTIEPVISEPVPSTIEPTIGHETYKDSIPFPSESTEDPPSSSPSPLLDVSQVIALSESLQDKIEPVAPSLAEHPAAMDEVSSSESKAPPVATDLKDDSAAAVSAVESAAANYTPPQLPETIPESSNAPTVVSPLVSSQAGDSSPVVDIAVPASAEAIVTASSAVLQQSDDATLIKSTAAPVALEDIRPTLAPSAEVNTVVDAVATVSTMKVINKYDNNKFK